MHGMRKKIRIGEFDERGNFIGRWGFIDTSGNEVVPPRYDYLGSFNEGLAAVRIGDWEDGRWGFVDASGEEVVSPRYDFVLAFSGDLALVRVANRWSFIDRSGEEAVLSRNELGNDETSFFAAGYVFLIRPQLVG